MAKKKKASKKKSPPPKEKKKSGLVRCSFRVPERKLRSFHAKAKANGHEVDELFLEFLNAYAGTATSSGVTVTVKKKKA